MVLHKLLRMLLSHPQLGPQLINKLAESWPIRTAARFTAYVYLRARVKVGEHLSGSRAPEELARSTRLERFKDTMRKEVKKGWEEVKRSK